MPKKAVWFDDARHMTIFNQSYLGSYSPYLGSQSSYLGSQWAYLGDRFTEHHGSENKRFKIKQIDFLWSNLIYN